MVSSFSNQKLGRIIHALYHSYSKHDTPPIAGTPLLCYHGARTVGGSGAGVGHEKEAAMAMPKTALEGIRVLDLGRTRPGRALGSSWRVWELR